MRPAGLDCGETAGPAPVVRGKPEDARGQRGVCGLGVRVRVVVAGVGDGGEFFGASCECGGDAWTDAVQVPRFVVVAGLAGLLEAFSVQNDNLTLPLYMWAMVVLADVVA